MAPRFDPPYGTKDQHVPAPAQHLGYHFLVAYLVADGKQAPYIRAECAAAHQQRAPKDVIWRDSAGHWHRRHQLQQLTQARRVDAYAVALNRYAGALGEERRR